MQDKCQKLIDEQAVSSFISDFPKGFMIFVAAAAVIILAGLEISRLV